MYLRFLLFSRKHGLPRRPLAFGSCGISWWVSACWRWWWPRRRERHLSYRMTRCTRSLSWHDWSMNFCTYQPLQLSGTRSASAGDSCPVNWSICWRYSISVTRSSIVNEGRVFVMPRFVSLYLWGVPPHFSGRCLSGRETILWWFTVQDSTFRGFWFEI